MHSKRLAKSRAITMAVCADLLAYNAPVEQDLSYVA